MEPFWNFIPEETLIQVRTVLMIMIAGFGFLNFKLVFTKGLNYCVSLQNTSYITNLLGIFTLWLASYTKAPFFEEVGSALFQLAFSTTASLILTTYLFFYQQAYQETLISGPLYISKRQITPEIDILYRMNMIMMIFLGLEWLIDSIKFENTIYSLFAAFI